MAMVVLTGLLFVSAAAAFVQVGRQIKLLNRQIEQTQKNHEEQLHVSQEPRLVIQLAEALMIRGREAEAYLIGAVVQNIGAGPALDIEFLGWARTVPPAGNETERRDSIERLRKKIKVQHPELTLRIGGVAANDKARRIQMVGEVVASKTEGERVLFYIATYSDIFKTKYPRAPQPEWDLGHTMIWPGGSWKEMFGN